MRKLSLVGLLVMLLLRPTVAAADTLTFQGYSTLTKGAWVNVTRGSQAVTGWAGEIEWYLNQSAANPAQKFSSYCADLFDDAVIPTQSGTLGTTSTLGSATSLNASQPDAGAKAAWLVENYWSGLSGYSAANAAAGLQIAVWDALYGAAGATGSQWSYAGWNIPTNVITQIADTMYGNLMTLYNGSSEQRNMVLSSTAPYFDVNNGLNATAPGPNGQDQIGTPEPAPILLLMTAMAVMLGYRYRLKRRGANV